MGLGEQRQGMHARAAYLAVSVVAFALGGCATTDQVKNGDAELAIDAHGDPSAAMTGELARARVELAPFVAQQNERAVRLATFESRASLEFRYSDATGEHFEQCEADIFLSPPNRGALRVMKVGTNLWWIGGDGDRSWIFELNVTPKRATVYDRGASGVFAEAGDVVGTGEFTLLSPESVRLLMGQAAIADDWTPVLFNGAEPAAPMHKRFGVRTTLKSTSDGAPRLTATTRFGADGLPISLTVASMEGVEVATATLRDPVRAPMVDIAQGAWPTVARRIEVVAPRSGAAIKIFLDSPTASANRMKPRFFELDALLTQLRPEVVEFVTKELKSKSLAPNSSEPVTPIPSVAPSVRPSRGEVGL